MCAAGGSVTIACIGTVTSRKVEPAEQAELLHCRRYSDSVNTGYGAYATLRCFGEDAIQTLLYTPSSEFLKEVPEPGDAVPLSSKTYFVVDRADQGLAAWIPIHSPFTSLRLYEISSHSTR
jgi:hypothetical protein